MRGKEKQVEYQWPYLRLLEALSLADGLDPPGQYDKARAYLFEYLEKNLMRSFIFLTTLVGICCCFSQSALAGEKIGYIDLRRAMKEVEEGKKAYAKLEKEMAKKKKQIEKMQTDLKVKSQEFEKRQGMMKPEARQQRQQELQREYMELQQTFMQLQQELTENETKLLSTVTKKLKKVLTRIGDRDSYTMILDLSQVHYFKKHLDITDQVIKEYNNLYK